MRVKRKALWVLLAVLCAGGTWAGIQYYLDNIKPPATPPGQVVERYFEALKRRDFAAAYAMVSRRHYFESFNQFIDRVSMYSPDMTLEVTQEQLEEAGAVVMVRISAPLRFGLYSSDSEMDLARDGREWKIIHP
jgi:hypothetical protein